MFSCRYIRNYPLNNFEKTIFINRIPEIHIFAHSSLRLMNIRFVSRIKVNLYDFENGLWVLRDE